MRNRKHMEKYRMTLTADQLRLIENALEEYFRLRMGQETDFANDLAGQNVDLSQDNPNHQRIFDMYVERRDAIGEIMKAVFRIAFPPYGWPEKKTMDVMNAQEIWDAIRVATGRSRWGDVLRIGNQPVPEIEKE